MTPLFQLYVTAPVPFKVTDVPAQIDWLGPPLTAGSGFTVTVTEAVFVQPFASVPVTVYVCVVLGANGTPLMTPLFQLYVTAPVPFRVTDVPAQIDWLGPALTVGKAFTETVMGGETALQPAALVTITA